MKVIHASEFTQALSLVTLEIRVMEVQFTRVSQRVTAPRAPYLNPDGARLGARPKRL